jgi:hypothetical protein
MAEPGCYFVWRLRFGSPISVVGCVKDGGSLAGNESSSSRLSSSSCSLCASSFVFAAFSLGPVDKCACPDADSGDLGPATALPYGRARKSHPEQGGDPSAASRYARRSSSRTARSTPILRRSSIPESSLPPCESNLESETRERRNPICQQFLGVDLLVSAMLVSISYLIASNGGPA